MQCVLCINVIYKNDFIRRKRIKLDNNNYMNIIVNKYTVAICVIGFGYDVTLYNIEQMALDRP